MICEQGEKRKWRETFEKQYNLIVPYKQQTQTRVPSECKRKAAATTNTLTFTLKHAIYRCEKRNKTERLALFSLNYLKKTTSYLR